MAEDKKTLTERLADEAEKQAGMGYLARTRRRVGALLALACLLGGIAAGAVLAAGFLWALLTVILLFIAGIAGIALVVGIIALIVALGLALF